MIVLISFEYSRPLIVFIIKGFKLTEMCYILTGSRKTKKMYFVRSS